MKKRRRLPPIHRSLVGQTTALSLALLVLAVAFLFFLPILTMERSDPLQRTLQFVISEVARARANTEAPLSSIMESEEIREAMAANSQFRLYVRRGAEDFQIGAPPRWTDAFNESKLRAGEVDPATMDYTAASSFSSVDFKEGDAIGRSTFRLFAEQDYYYEVGGIEVPIESATRFLAGFDPTFFWLWFQDYLAVGGAILAGVLFLLFLLIRSLRRLAHIAQSLDPQAPSHRLPERGLPIEILPMVQAINQMIRRIDEANEEQAFFLAAAAHELRTPLAVVRTRLESLPESADKDDLREDLRRMTRLVDQLLRLMSVRNKATPSSAVDLVSIARNVVADRAPLVIDKGVEIDLDATGESVRVQGDERLLEVALANLVDNALSFSKSGQRLQVKVGPERNITVHDQGPGIPDTELENIFRPFSKNPPNRRGHGLGLAITRSIMALHGGSVKAANQKGGGATFALQF